MLGAGYKFNDRLSLLAEWNFNRMGVPHSLAFEQAQVPDGNEHIWTIDLNPKFNVIQRGRTDGYVIGGGGFSRALTSFTFPSMFPAAGISTADALATSPLPRLPPTREMSISAWVASGASRRMIAERYFLKHAIRSSSVRRVLFLPDKMPPSCPSRWAIAGKLLTLHSKKRALLGAFFMIRRSKLQQILWIWPAWSGLDA